MHRSPISSRTRTRGRGRLSSPLGVGALLQAFEKYAESTASNQTAILERLNQSSTAQKSIVCRCWKPELETRAQCHHQVFSLSKPSSFLHRPLKWPPRPRNLLQFKYCHTPHHPMQKERDQSIFHYMMGRYHGRLTLPSLPWYQS